MKYSNFEITAKQIADSANSMLAQMVGGYDKEIDQSAYTSAELSAADPCKRTERTFNRIAVSKIRDGEWEQVWKKNAKGLVCKAYRIVKKK